MTNMQTARCRKALRGISLAAALLFLNATVTFHNVWPTLGIRWPGELSVELAALLLLLSLWSAWRGPPSRIVIALLAAVVVLFALGRYAEVTAPALYGREINLYWDIRHVAAVTGMITRVAPAWVVTLLALGAITSIALLFLGTRWALSRVCESLQTREICHATACVATALLCWFAVQRLSDDIPRVPQFSIPVTKTYTAQIRLILDTFASSRAARSLPPSPPMPSDLSALGGSDVLVVFLESYGRVTYDRPEFARNLMASRARLAAAIHETGRSVVSAFVESPTFGGGSWLAHLSFLSGIEVRDPDRYALLMTQQRPTLASVFANQGYRVVALMPGLRQNWPEGRFYNFAQIYDAATLDYRGPEFGWWRIPDQFALARFDALELRLAERQPLFLFFPTISTHMPFRPTPPYQPRWDRMLTEHPYDSAVHEQAIAQTPEWTDMGESYVGAVKYSLKTIEGYLRERADRNFVMIILGDHQPPANVSGQGASWDVPVHVITSNVAILESLKRHGFTEGLMPSGSAIARTHELSLMLLEAFGADEQPHLRRASNSIISSTLSPTQPFSTAYIMP